MPINREVAGRAAQADSDETLALLTGIELNTEATGTKLDTSNAKLDTINTSVGELLTDTELRAAPVPVSLSSVNYYVEVLKGNIPGHSMVHKFGAGQVPNGTFEAITHSGAYQVPTTATALEFVSTSAQDGVGGTGAREVTLVGLDADWLEVTQTLTTNGTTAVPLTTNLTRLYRWYVSSTGTYATSTTASQAGDLIIRGLGGGTVWDTILLSPLGESQSTIGVYTIPKGKTGYLLSKSMLVDSNKDADLYLFQRPNADDVASPYSGARRIIEKDLAISGPYMQKPMSPKGPFVGPCDIGFIGKGNAAVADVSVEFELLLVDDGF